MKSKVPNKTGTDAAATTSVNKSSHPETAGIVTPRNDSAQSKSAKWHDCINESGMKHISELLPQVFNDIVERAAIACR